MVVYEKVETRARGKIDTINDIIVQKEIFKITIKLVIY